MQLAGEMKSSKKMRVSMVSTFSLIVPIRRNVRFGHSRVSRREGTDVLVPAQRIFLWISGI
jgi:hypothetical protein